MKKTILSLGIILFASNLFAQSFISPIDFIQNEENKHLPKNKAPLKPHKRTPPK